MKKIVMTVCLATATLSLVSCSAPKQQEEPQPTKAEQERREKEYQKGIDDLRKFTEGSKAVLDKAPRQQPASPTPKTRQRPQAQKQSTQAPSQDHQ